MPSDVHAGQRPNFGKLQEHRRQQNSFKAGRLLDDGGKLGRPGRRNNPESLNRAARMNRSGGQAQPRRAQRPSLTPIDADRRLNKALKNYNRDVARGNTLLGGRNNQNSGKPQGLGGSTERRVRRMITDSVNKTSKKVGLQDFATGKGLKSQLKKGGFVKEDPLGNFTMM